MPATKVEIDVQNKISTVAFLDAEHILTGGEDGIIRRWRTSDGRQVEPELDADSEIRCLAVSAEWIVAGTRRDGAAVWDAKTFAKSTTLQEQAWIRAVDISRDSRKIATSSDVTLVIDSDIDRDRGQLLPLWSKAIGRLDSSRYKMLWICLATLSLVTLASSMPRIWGVVLWIWWVMPWLWWTAIWTAIWWKIWWVVRRWFWWTAISWTTIWCVLAWRWWPWLWAWLWWTMPQLASLLALLMYTVTKKSNSSQPNVEFSPDGNRIAFHEGDQFIRVFDTVDGKQLIRIKNSTSAFAWSRNSQQLLFVTSSNKIASISVTNGSLLFQWTWKDFHPKRMIAMPKNDILVSHDSDVLAFWDASTKSRIGPVLGVKGLSHICLSRDGLYLACARWDKITIQYLQQLLPYAALFGKSHQENLLQNNPDGQSVAGGDSALRDEQNEGLQSSSSIQASQLPLLHLSDAAFVPWAKGDIARAQGILEEEIRSLSNCTHRVVAHHALHYALANRAFVRACQRDWKGAQEDAEKSLESHLSVIGLIAKSIALVGLGRHAEAFGSFDLVLTRCEVNDSKLLLLIKYVLFCMAKKYDDAIAHVTCLMDSADGASIYLIVQISGWRFEGLKDTVREHLRSTLFLALRRTQDIVGSRFRSTTTFPEERATNTGTINCEHLEGVGDEASSSNKQEEAISYYTAALSLDLPTDNTLFEKWANTNLSQSSWEDTFNIAIELRIPEYLIYQVICDILKRAERLYEATECFCKMEKELPLRMSWCDDGAVETTLKHSDAIQLYSAALLLKPGSKTLLLSRSKVLALAGRWEAALRDADKVIDLYPSSHLGYERRHVALLTAKHYDDSFKAYEMMHAKLLGSPYWDTDPSSDLYISPSKIDETIHRAVESTIRNSPSVLINTNTGRLRHKSQQASDFATTQAYKELRASMTTKIDDTHIKESVEKYYEYAMLSHTWEHGGDSEPSFQLLERTTVYELQKTSTNDKLQQFCSLVRGLGYVWAWSDTCCIDQLNQVVLQESLVSMFRWYRGSAMTVVFLREAAEELDSLEKSYWNTRVWTYQEYVAAEVIRFYTKGWKPYGGLLATINPTRNDAVRKELESNMTTRSAQALQPGLEDIRRKLHLASTRNTTKEEDAAYSLFGIFNVSMPVIYGEGGSAALGRLLAHLLTASGDASILAWTGKSGSFNSCFPVNITVFEHLATPHLPVPLDDNKMHSIVGSLRPSLDQELELSALILYNRLNELTVPSFSANRMILPCIMFELGPLLPIQTDRGRLYRADTVVLGEVDIHTQANLLSLGPLYLIHPWLNALLSRKSGTTKRVLRLPTVREGEKPVADFEGLHGPSPLPSLPPLSTDRAPLDELTRALRFVACLRQKFGALLLTYTDIGFRRVASDALIDVQVKADLPLKDLIDNLDIRTVDIL